MRRLVRGIFRTKRGQRYTTSFSPEDGRRPFDSGLIAGKGALPFLENENSSRSSDDSRILFRYGVASRRGLQRLRVRNRAVEQFDHVEHLLIRVMHGGAGAELQQAARVGGND